MWHDPRGRYQRGEFSRMALWLEASEMKANELLGEFQREVWRTPRIIRYGGFLALAGNTVLLATLIQSVGDAIFYLGYFVVPVWVFGWLIAVRPRAELASERLIVINPVTSHQISYDDVVGTGDGWAGPIVRLSSGKSIRVFVVQKSNFQLIFRLHSRADDFTRELTHRCPNVVSPES
jgi:hypothetical protein